jgi:hypothetical protein
MTEVPVTNAAITLEQRAATYFDEQIKEPLRTILIGRQLFAKTTVIGPDKYRVNYNKIKEIGAAIDASELDLVLHWKQYEIPRQDWDVFKSIGVNMNAVGAISAAYMTGLLEDTTLLVGFAEADSTYTLEGMLNLTGHTAVSGADTGTYGNAIKTVAAGWTAFDTARVLGCNMNLVLSPFNYEELQASISTVGIREYPVVVEMLNQYPSMPKGQVFKCPVDQSGTPLVPQGSGIMCPVDPNGRFMDLVVGANYVNDVFLNGPSQMFSPMAGMVVTSFVPRFTYPTAIGHVTGMG